ncbi:hypothetical protein EV663_11730 [Rhodovulum bhavnagarense]|uniref:Glycosyltransferase involved in cell wall biosynthesis n=1 Tax=Rhodovulum bhavnagarense TaxID=992286 RepID=A0A4R2R961_9RHOB|nr:hypothetical protein [Rhodovulum bhavnagarense]TCP58764.1 hypothetical protein EV663_11730 [Rhodovulum bhavnagarense]
MKDSCNFRGVAFAKSLGGHRDDYLTLFSKSLALENGGAFTFHKHFIRAITAKYLLFVTVDAHVGTFLFLSGVRAALRKRTVAISVAPDEVNTRLSRLQKTFRGALRRTNSVTILGIRPFDICPADRSFADDWIFDPQLWDLKYLLKHSEQGDPRACRRSHGREGQPKRLYFLGHGSRRKGFDLFLDLSEQISGGYEFKMVGLADNEFAHRKIPNAEGKNKDGSAGHASFKDFIDAYLRADLIWCYYPAESNLSSGIFGRAIQLGAHAIVRKDSYLSKFAEKYNLAYSALEDPVISARISALVIFSGCSEQSRFELIDKFEKLSLARLERAFGG